MLKLTYTENSFNLEYIDQSWERWINARVVLALRTGSNIHIKNTTASFLVRLDSSELADLAKAVAYTNRIDICRCDADFVEVTLKGMWITSSIESEVGVFVTALDNQTELYLQRLEQNHSVCHA